MTGAAPNAWFRAATGGLAAGLMVLSAGCGSTVAVPAGTAAPHAVSDFGRVLAASHDLGPVAATRRLTLDLLLQAPAGPDPEAGLAAIDDPRSPDFGRYLSPAEYDARYGPDPAAVQRLAVAAASLGLDLTWRTGAVDVTLSGPAAAFEQALAVRVDDFRDPGGRRFWSATSRPVLPEALRGGVEPVERLTSWTPPLKRDAVRPGGVTPADLSIAYDYKQLRDDGIDGSGQTVVFWELGDGFKQSDLDLFNRKFNLPPAQVQVVGPAGAKSEGETIMDVETVHAVAPGARLIVYTLGSDQRQIDDSTLMPIVDRTITDNPGAILSYSWGGCEQGSDTTQLRWYQREFTKAGQLGESVFASTGDNGGYDCLDPRDTRPNSDGVGVSLPAAAPGVVAVGGTRLSLSKTGARFSEVPWKYAPSTGGTGGGVSTSYPRPTWQQGPGVANRWNPRNMRSLPDVSAIGDPETGLSIISDQTALQGGGTSLSTPIWSGITALMNQYLQRQGLKPVGFLDPALYAIAAGHPQYAAFHDVSEGGNLVYPAARGYDLASGLGTPDVWNLVRDVEAYQKAGGHV